MHTLIAHARYYGYIGVYTEDITDTFRTDELLVVR